MTTDIRYVLIVDEPTGESFAFGPWAKDSAETRLEKIALAYPTVKARILPLLTISNTASKYPAATRVPA